MYSHSPICRSLRSVGSLVVSVGFCSQTLNQTVFNGLSLETWKKFGPENQQIHFFTTNYKQIVKLFNYPTPQLCSNLSKYSHHHCGTQPATTKAMQVCCSSQSQIPTSHSNILTCTNNRLPHIQKAFIVIRVRVCDRWGVPQTNVIQYFFKLYTLFYNRYAFVYLKELSFQLQLFSIINQPRQ